MNQLKLTSVLLVLLLAVTACVSQEVLVPHSASAPAGVDFSGTWIIREDESASRRSITRAANQVGDPGKSTASGVVDVFVEIGRVLKITQTQHGFFVSLDRSVVEEFRFGESRIINIGEIEAQRVSGWDGPVYTVQTLDKKRMKMIDRFWLDENSDTLLREITFYGRNEKSASVMQYFDRRDP